jgi:hypothetical protein
VFAGNASSSSGGAISTRNSSPEFINCAFIGNRSSFNGGAMSNDDAPAKVTNCSFSGNEALNFGGAIFNGSSGAVVTNCIIWGNSSGINNAASTPVVNYSIIQGGYAGTGNLNVDPLFITQPPVGLGTAGNLALQTGSPAINAGQTSANTSTTDLAGNPRVSGSSIDMGAYEVEGSAPAPPKVLYVDVTAKGNNDGSSWANAFISLANAFNVMNTTPSVEEVHIAWGIHESPAEIPFTIDRPNVLILGGYPSGGGTRNPASFPVFFKGEVRMLKDAKLDGIQVIPKQ